MPWTWLAILACGAVGGAAAGWLVAPLLVPEGWGRLLGVVMMPAAAWIGVLAAYPVARITHERRSGG